MNWRGCDCINETTRICLLGTTECAIDTFCTLWIISSSANFYCAKWYSIVLVAGQNVCSNPAYSTYACAHTNNLTVTMTNCHSNKPKESLSF